MNTDWHTILGIVSTLVITALLYPYIRSVLYGDTKPNVVSWAGWCFLDGVATAIQFSKGADWSVVIPLLATISTGIVAVFAIRLGYAKFTKTDILCLVLGALAFALWVFADQPLVALLLGIIADLFISGATVVKTYQEPQSEPFGLWAIYTAATMLAVLATTKLDVYNLLVPLYSVGVSGVIALLALRGKIAKDRA